MATRENNKSCLEYWIKRGKTEEDYREFLKAVRLKAATTYMMKNGKTEEEAIAVHERNLWKKHGITGRIRCEICGSFRDSLLSHIPRKHKMTIEQYKEKFYDAPVMTDMYKARKNTSVGYWTAQGYTAEQAGELFLHRQSTFSLEKCISRFGLVEGTKKWTERQGKWQQTMVNKSEQEKAKINAAKSVSLQDYKEKHGSEWLKEFSNRLQYTKKSTSSAISCIENCTSLESLSVNMVGYIARDRVRSFLRTKVAREFYEINDSNEEQVYRAIMSQYNVGILNKKMYYGTLSVYGGLVLRSLGELEIAKWLDSRNIEYRYDKKYPFINNARNLRYDFYLPSIELYVEFCGMMDNRKCQQAVHQSYSKKIDHKKQMCLEGALHCIFSNDVSEIKTYIERIVNEQKSND
jgi:hypothetical protein